MLSRTGLAFGGLYALFSAACLVAYFHTGDPKGAAIFLHLPIVLQEALIHELGGSALLMRAGWGAYGVLLAATALVMYLLGALAREAIRRTRR